MNLVIRFSALGDLVLCSAFVKTLKGPTVFVTQNSFKNFVEEFFEGDQLQVYGVDKPKSGLWGWFNAGRRMGNFLRVLGSPRISLLNIFDLHNVSKSIVFSWGLLWELHQNRVVSQIRLSRTPKERIRRWFLLIFKRDLPSQSMPVYKRHLSLLTEEIPKLTPALKVSPPKPKHFPGCGNTLRILIAPDAQHWKKIWPIEYWKTFLRELSQKSELPIEVTIVSQRVLIEKEFLDFIQNHASQSFYIRNLQSKTTLMELPQIASEHDLLICGNTAWLHIAEATGTPVLSLAGPIVPPFGFSPFRKDSFEFQAPVFCRPCTLHGDGICPWTGSWHHACMKNITPQMMMQRMWKQLGYGSAPR